jgi:GT2 family glycosyltransferase
LAKREVFLEIGEFDERFVNGCEDVDLCLRMSEAGLAHYVVHDSVVEHVKGASEGRKLKNDENSRILNEKWGERIRGKQSVADQLPHARTYLFRGLTSPWLVNFSKFMQAAAILLRLTQLK